MREARHKANEAGDLKLLLVDLTHLSSGALLKVLDGISHCRKPVNATNPILSSFNAKQVTDGSMGLDEAQNDSALGKFSMKV
jgi:hypothetical protein